MTFASSELSTVHLSHFSEKLQAFKERSLFCRGTQSTAIFQYHYNVLMRIFIRRNFVFLPFAPPTDYKRQPINRQPLGARTAHNSLRHTTHHWTCRICPWTCQAGATRCGCRSPRTAAGRTRRNGRRRRS